MRYNVVPAASCSAVYSAAETFNSASSAAPPRGPARTVALPAQVQLHEMTQPAGRRAFHYRAHQGGCLDIGQVPSIAEDALDQLGHSAAGVLQGHVVIELDGQQIDFRQVARQVVVPAAEVGDVTDRPTLAEQVHRSFQPKSEGGAAVVPHRQRPAAKSRREREVLMRLERADQVAVLQRDEAV